MDREVGAYAPRFDERSLWKKIARFARRAGRGVIERVLILYYCMQDPYTPEWAKSVIISALAYFILPIDAIPDVLVFAGFIDDFGVLAAALGMVVSHIKPEHREQAEDKLFEWFGARDYSPPSAV